MLVVPSGLFFPRRIGHVCHGSAARNQQESREREKMSVCGEEERGLALSQSGWFE
tara:strand:+ start:218 stop:382 length:165 start_codon:yes stop_codon:yes gene_type:complete